MGNKFGGGGKRSKPDQVKIPAPGVFRRVVAELLVVNNAFPLRETRILPRAPTPRAALSSPRRRSTRFETSYDLPATCRYQNSWNTRGTCLRRINACPHPEGANGTRGRGWLHARDRDRGSKFPCTGEQKMERVSSALSRDTVEFSDVVNRRMDHTSDNCRPNDVYINPNNDYDC